MHPNACRVCVWHDNDEFSNGGRIMAGLLPHRYARLAIDPKLAWALSNRWRGLVGSDSPVAHAAKRDASRAAYTMSPFRTA